MKPTPGLYVAILDRRTGLDYWARIKSVHGTFRDVILEGAPESQPLIRLRPAELSTLRESLEDAS